MKRVEYTDEKIPGSKVVLHPTEEDISELINEHITIAVTRTLGMLDDPYFQLSVHGKLEKIPDENRYRVILTDYTFAYFRAKDVGLMSIKNDTGTHCLHLLMPEQLTDIFVKPEDFAEIL